jgi:hypothetical protein
VECGTKRQQSVELAGIVADAIGSGDEDLPTLFHKGPSLVDRDNNAQPYRRHGFFTSCRLHNEGHGNPFLRKCPMTRSSNFRSSASKARAPSECRSVDSYCVVSMVELDRECSIKMIWIKKIRIKHQT